MSNPVYTTDIIKAQLQNLIVCHNYKVSYTLHYTNKNFEAYLDKNTLEFRANNTIQNVFVVLTKDIRINGVLLEIKAVDLDNESTLVHSSFVVCDNFDSCEPAYPSPTPTPSVTATPTVTPTVTPSFTPTVTITPTVTPSNTVTPSITPSNTVTPSITPSNTATPSVTPSITPTTTVTPTNTPTQTSTPTNTPTQTTTPTNTPTQTGTPAVTPTQTRTPAVTPTQTITPTPTITPVDCFAGTVWQNFSLPTDRSWKSVAYGNGKWIAVASGSSVGAISTDGYVWNILTLPGNVPWNNVVYGNGTFIISALNSTVIATSEDGTTWTLRTLPNGVTWQDMVYGNGTFMAIGTSQGFVRTSSSADGITWYGLVNLVTFGPPESIKIHFGGGSFIATYSTSGSNVIHRSTDNGNTWVLSPTITPNNAAIDGAYGNGIFVLIGNNLLLTSTGLISWTTGSIPSYNWNSVAFGNNRFVAFADGANVAAISSNGTAWTLVNLPTNTFWQDVSYGDNKFVAIGGELTGAISSCS